MYHLHTDGNCKHLISIQIVTRITGIHSNIMTPYFLLHKEVKSIVTDYVAVT